MSPAPANRPNANRPGANRPGANRPKQRQSLTRSKRRSSATKLTWAAVAVVVVVVLVIVLIDTLGGSKPAKQKLYFGAAPPALVAEVTGIPASVYNSIGVTSPVVKVSGFAVLAGQKPLTFPSGSKTLPGFLYYGAEYCPYCAATRWGIIAALSRFGTFSNLQLMKSSSTDVYPSTNTFSFRGSTYTSKYLVFKPFEVENRDGAEIKGEVPTGALSTLISKYNPNLSFPFLDMDNKVFLVGAPYDPQVLQGESWSQIGSQLDQTSSFNTQAIVATANYISAGICAMTHDEPTSVCHSSAVTAADHALERTAG